MSASRYLSIIAGILCALLLLQGCGGADSSPSRNRGSIGDGGGGGGGDGGDDGGNSLPVIDVRVEGTAGIAEGQSVATWLLQSLLPAQAHALTGLESLEVQEIRVVRVDHDGNVLSTNPFSNNAYTIDYGNPDGSHSIKFSAKYEGAMDLVIEAELPNGVIMRRPLPTTRKGSGGQPHAINIATEYATRQFFQRVDSAEFEEMTNCANDNTTCTTQSAQKLINWLGLFEAVVDFDLSLPDDLDFNAALEFLDDQVAFSRYVDRSINALRADIIGGSDDRGNLPDPVQAAVGNYNGLSFSLELNQGIESTVLANWTSAVATLSSDAGSTAYYPFVTLSNLGTPLISTLITGDMPRLRNQLTQSGPSQFEPSLIDDTEKKENAQRNFLGLTGVFSSLTTTGFHDFGVMQTQAVTGQGAGEQLTGWLSNPYFASLYDANAQDALLDARVTDGAVYNLTRVGSGYSRQYPPREIVNNFSFYAYSKRADHDKKPNSGDDFHEGTLHGQTYGLVSLTQNFSDPTLPIQVSSSIRHWRADATSRQIQESQPASSNLFQTWTLSRDSSSVPSPLLVNPRMGPVARVYQALPSEMYDNTTGTTYDSFNGRLSVNAPGDAWEGIADSNGRFLSFVINNAVEGQGIAHAVQLQTSNQEPPSGTYRLVGNGFGQDTDTNYLFHVDNGRLVFGIDGTVRLHMNQVRAVQNVTTQEVSGLTTVTFEEEPSLVTDSTHAGYDPSRYTFGEGDIRNSIRMVFDDPRAGGSDPLILEGFVTAQDPQQPEAGGRVMVLRMRHGDSVGLVYGFYEKDLASN